jgi:hypothetical protein
MQPSKIFGLVTAGISAISTNLSFAGKLDIEYVVPISSLPFS